MTANGLGMATAQIVVHYADVFTDALGPATYYLPQCPQVPLMVLAGTIPHHIAHSLTDGCTDSNAMLHFRYNANALVGACIHWDAEAAVDSGISLNLLLEWCISSTLQVVGSLVSHFAASFLVRSSD